jgi:hypothetical protein
MEIRPMEAKVMIVEGKRTKRLRKRDVANRHFAFPRMRLNADEEINYLSAILLQWLRDFSKGKTAGGLASTNHSI